MTPEDQIYEKQLGASYWYVKNKILLKNILIITLIILDIFLISYFLYFLIFNLVIYQKIYQANLTNFTTPVPEYATLRQFNLPSSIQVLGITTYNNTKGYDIMAEIFNANPKWYATFDYQFKIGDNLTAKRKSFVYPNEKKRLLDLSVEDGNLVSQIVFSNINWQKRIDFSDLYQQRFKFEITNVKYTPASELGLEQQKVPVNRVSFDVENLTAFNYKNLNLLIFLNSNGQIAAVNQVPSDILRSGEKITIDVNFFQSLPNIDSVEVTPEANIFNETTFLKF